MTDDTRKTFYIRKTFRPKVMAQRFLMPSGTPLHFDLSNIGNTLTVQIGDATYTMITNLEMPEDAVPHPDGRHIILVYPKQADERVPVVQCRIDGATLVAEHRGAYRPTEDGWYVLEGDIDIIPPMIPNLDHQRNTV